MVRDRKPYRIIGAYDSETTNVNKLAHHYAFPVLHQLGILDCPVEDVTAENVEEHCSISLYRHAVDLYGKMNEIAETEYPFVPVICCHNLSFDMYGLSPWLDSLPNVRVLAKSKRKPITFTIRDDAGNARLVLWDTLVFTGQSLERMGADCGYSKAVGEWDYDLIRTPETPLTDDEIEYAEKDVYALLAWFGWWLKRNPDIAPEKLGLNVVTKTGIVRERRKLRFDGKKGEGAKYDIGRFWHYVNRTEAPKTDDELYTMFAATRGGFTFCSSRNASVPFDLVDTDYTVAGYDATSQHPAQMVSHFYPVGFHETSARTLDNAFYNVAKRSVDYVLKRFEKPFNAAFYAVFEFGNLRLKENSLFEKCGIASLASARILDDHKELDEENEQFQQFREHLVNIGYQDMASNPKFAFGKLVSADRAVLFLTELEAWIMAQVYEWDYVKAVHGYMTGRFVRPTDMSTVSVMQFYKAKNEFKKAREDYYKHGTIYNGDILKSLGIAENTVEAMENGTATDSDVDSSYQSTKANLNALFGIEASNEYRRDTVLTSSGIDYEGEFGIVNKPKNPKAWYQFGQRIVGWSRIAQVLVMQLAYPHVETIVNGDTDSVKFHVSKCNLCKVNKALERYAYAVDRAKEIVLQRCKRYYPDYYDELKYIGHYVLEFESERFCASWNKAYCSHDVDPRDNKCKFAFTLAGIPARAGVNQAADQLYDRGVSFDDVCSLMLGYNVTYAHSVIRLNARSFPEWGAGFFDTVEDYKGNVARVAEPAALALYPMSKTVNDTRNIENRENMRYALENNGNVNTEPVVCSLNTNGDYVFARWEND